MPSRERRSKAKKWNGVSARSAPWPRFNTACSAEKLGLPSASKAMISPSINAGGRSSAFMAPARGLNLSVQSKPLRVYIFIASPLTATSARYPSYLISCIHSLPTGTLSTNVASCGLMKRGIASVLAFALPFVLPILALCALAACILSANVLPFAPFNDCVPAMSPAICAMERSVRTLVSARSTRSPFRRASPSSILRSNQFSRFSPARPFIRTNSHSPFIRSPCSMKWR